MGGVPRERRFLSFKDANWSAVSDRDIGDIAAIFVREHGAKASRQAADWADLMLQRGDRVGHASWRRVMWAVEEIHHRALRRAAGRAAASLPDSEDLDIPRLYPDIDRNLEQVIQDTLSAARAEGRDDLGQTEQALRAAQQARPTLSVPDALSAVVTARRR